jgi:hypothetical protein
MAKKPQFETVEEFISAAAAFGERLFKIDNIQSAIEKNMGNAIDSKYGRGDKELPIDKGEESICSIIVRDSEAVRVNRTEFYGAGRSMRSLGVSSANIAGVAMAFLIAASLHEREGFIEVSSRKATKKISVNI